MSGLMVKIFPQFPKEFLNIILLSGVLSGLEGCSNNVDLDHNAINVAGIECQDSQWDFGTVAPDIPKVEHEFELTNSTDSPIALLDVRTSCGCVLIESKPDVVPANDSIKLKVQMKTAGRVGPLQQSVLVLVDGSQHDELLTLTLRGNVTSPTGLHLTPDQINFGRLAPGEMATRKVVVESTDGSPVEISSIDDPLGNLECFVKPGADPSRVSLHATFKAGQPGKFFSKISVFRDGYNGKPVEVKLQAEVVQPRYGIVQRVFIPKIAIGSPLSVNLREDKDNTMLIDEVVFEGDEEITCSLDKPETENVEIVCKKSNKKVLQGKIIVKLSNGANVQVPLIALNRSR